MRVVQEPASAGHAIAESGVTIRIADPTKDPRWDEKLSHLSEITFFHSSAWCKVLRQTYGFQPCYAVAEDEDGQVCGVLPLMGVDNWPKGRRGIGLPFTDECQLLGARACLQQRLFDASVEEGKRQSWHYLEIRGRKGLNPNPSPSLAFYGHRLPIQPDENAIFARFDPAVQRAVRKASRAGLRVEIATGFEALRTFYQLHCKTRRKHGAAPQSFKFFKAIHEQILDRGYGFIVIARVGNKPVAAAVFFQLGTRAVFKYGASNERFQHFRGNNLVIWEAICRLARQGCKELDFGRTSMQNEGLRRFKIGWGSSESQINYLKYDLKQDRFVKALDHASGWHSRLFKLFPAPLSQCIGALLYPRLA